MIPIPLEEEYRNMTRKELESKLMEMPELESEKSAINNWTGEAISEQKAGTISEPVEKQFTEAQLEEEKDELIHKRMNDINTFQAHENEVYLRGTDEYGKDFQICFDSYNFLEWIDTEHLEYIKKQLIKHIKTK